MVSKTKFLVPNPMHISGIYTVKKTIVKHFLLVIVKLLYSTFCRILTELIWIAFDWLRAKLSTNALIGQFLLVTLTISIDNELQYIVILMSFTAIFLSIRYGRTNLFFHV